MFNPPCDEDVQRTEALGREVIATSLQEIRNSIKSSLVDFNPNEKVYPKKKLKVDARFSFITLSLDKNAGNRLTFEPSIIKDYWVQMKDAMADLSQSYPMNGYLLWIESGKNQNSPNLHTHIIIDFQNKKNPNLARWWRNKWNFMFPSNPMTKNDEYKNEQFTSKYLDDKIDYCFNEYKDTLFHWLILIPMKKCILKRS